MRDLEWWPDYGGGPVWEGGRSVDLGSMDVPNETAARVVGWNSRYREDRLPLAGPGDPDWLAEGIELLAELRKVLDGSFTVSVTEPWWGELPQEP